MSQHEQALDPLVGGAGISKARQAVVTLREQILDRRLAPGTRLTLRPLARALGMSVGAVSEALRELAHERLVDFEPSFGARVIRLDLETIRSQHVLRIAIECETIRRCTDRISERQLDQLAALAAEVDRLTDVEQRLSEARSTDLRFHLRIAELTGVPSLLAALESCHLVRLMAVESSPSREATEIPNRTHLALIEAIRSHDADLAEQAMREHCEHSLRLQVQSTFGAAVW